MIPTLIVLGLIFGRWWRLVMVAAAFGWPLALVVGDVMSVTPGLAGASFLAVVNAGVGVLVHQVVLQLVQLRRKDRAEPVSVR